MRAHPSLALMLAAALLLALAPSMAQPAEQPCERFQVVPGQGPSCPIPGGWQVFLRDGSSVLTHGPDPPPPEGPGLAAAPRAPVCVDHATQHHGHAIYAVAEDRANRYAAMAATVRGYIAEANGVLVEESAEFSVTIQYKFRCEGGIVELDNVTLPTPAAETTFSTIVSDLRDRGFDDPLAKYWVWYDGSVAGFCGQGTVRSDDRLSADNANNQGNDFGITYGCAADTMMHENGHNLGAVQLSAPDSSGAWHCFDGQDVMCYADGGPNGTYDPAVCTDREHWDCGHDSYFNPKPAAGTYLATHWNLGSNLVRFLQFACITDTAPPITTAALSGTQGPVQGYYRTAVSVNLTARDDCPGVPRTEYRLDGGPWTPYAAPFSVTAEGAHLAEFHSTDVAGNVEPPVSVAFTIDLTKPVLVNTAPNRTIYTPAGPVCCNLPAGYAIGGGQPALLVDNRVTDNIAALRVFVRGAFFPVVGEPALHCVAPVVGQGASCLWVRENWWEPVEQELHLTAEDFAGNTASAVVRVLG